MASEDGDYRTWPYVIALVLLVAGAFWGREVEVSQRTAARNATSALSFPLERLVSEELATLRACVAGGRCRDPGSLGFPPGNVHNSDSSDEQYFLMLVDQLSPELHRYYLLNFEWNEVVRRATLADGTITDLVALTELLDGSLPGQLADELARSRDESADQRDRGRLLSRCFGWGWKLCLMAIFMLPVGRAIVQGRRHRRMLDAQWREAKLRANPTPLIPVGRADGE
jgi:hypothetical protein